MVPVAVGQVWVKKYTSWSTFVLDSYQSRLEEMLQAIDALAFMDLSARLKRYLSDKNKSKATSPFTRLNKTLPKTCTPPGWWCLGC